MFKKLLEKIYYIFLKLAQQETSIARIFLSKYWKKPPLDITSSNKTKNFKNSKKTFFLFLSD